jgi:hypothetical protein
MKYSLNFRNGFKDNTSSYWLKQDLMVAAMQSICAAAYIVMILDGILQIFSTFFFFCYLRGA